MAAYYLCVNQLRLLALLFSCLCGLATVHAAGAPLKMPPPVGKPGPPVLSGISPDIVAYADNHWDGIKQWTSLGDSYATGVGVGKSLAWNRCVHFSDAYPLLMNKDSRMPGGWGDRRKLWDCSCSGATTADIIEHQFLNKPETDPIYGHRSEFGSPQIATLTAGGDDIEFLWLILYCIVQFFKNNPCGEQITRSRGFLESDKFYNYLDYAVKVALIRGINAAGPGFKLFVTGYAQFFNEDTDQCDHTCFSYWDPECKNSRKLDKPLRKQLNQLAKDLNQRIQAVVKNNKQWGVEYVDYDADFAGHRFCEKGNIEPDNNNPDIWFFQLDTKGNGRTPAIDDRYAALLDEHGKKDDFYAAVKKRSATLWATGLQGRPDAAAYDLLFRVGDATKDVQLQSALSGYIRMCHPTRPGLDAIAASIFKHFPTWPKPDPPPKPYTPDASSPIAAPQLLGHFICKDSGIHYMGIPSFLDDTCICWYEHQPTVTGLYTRPLALDRCADITKPPDKPLDVSKSQHRRGEIGGGGEEEEGGGRDEIGGGGGVQKRDVEEGGKGEVRMEDEEKDVEKLEELVRRHPARRYMGRRGVGG